MKSQIAIGVYKIKPGFEAELLATVEKHSQVLRGQGYLTERPELILKQGQDYVLEIIEWQSEESASAAHSNPKVLELWGEYEKYADFITLGDLPAEVLGKPFPSFVASVPARSIGRKATYSDNMISAENFEETIGFYQDSFGLTLGSKNESFAVLVDPVSKQKLCITNGPSVSKMSPGISTSDLSETLKSFESRGGKITKRWEYKYMIGANCHDKEGNEVMIWESRSN